MRQTTIPGTEPPDDPPRDEEIELGIEHWYRRIAEQKLAAEATGVSHEKLLELMDERGYSKYPFLEPGTGKRKYLVADAKRRLRSEAAPTPKQEQADREWAQAQAEGRGAGLDPAAIGKRAQTADQALANLVGAVERVTRSGGKAMVTVAEPADPFGATRARMTGDKARGSTETPAQLAAREAEEARANRRARGRRAKP